jgi:hypothetical protein
MTHSEDLGTAFAQALAAKDFSRISGLLHPQIDFRGLTPGRAWEANGPDEVDGVLRQWFEEDDQLEELLDLQLDQFADRRRVGYRFRGRNDDGPFVVEQQAYLEERDGLIGWMRVVCSGFRIPG